MLPVTDRAKAYLQSLRHGTEARVLVILVQWNRGDSDLKRSPTGDVIWEHSGPRGWTVEVLGYAATKVTSEWGQPVAPGVYVDLSTHGQRFPGGTIDYPNGHLFLRGHAA
jgi:hypothetical protein